MDNLLKAGAALQARVMELCEKKGITVNRLEREVPNLAQGSIKNWDKHMPSIDRVAAVADYFGVSIDYLYGYENDYEKDLKRLMDMASWLTKEDVAALLVVAEQLKKGK